MLFKIKSNPMLPLSGALPYVPAHVTRSALVAHRHSFVLPRLCLLIVGLLSIAEALCHYLCLFGTILVTLCLMVWDWRVLRAEPMLSCWHDLLSLFLSPTVLSFSSFHGLVVWVWGLWTDRVFSLSTSLAQGTPK